MNPSSPFARISTLPPGTLVSSGYGPAFGSHMSSYQPFAAAPAPAPQPCPFSLDDVSALKAVAAPLRQAIGAPHEPISNPSDLATLILRLEHVTKKIEAIITLHTP